MDAKTAVAAAKNAVADLFGDENPMNIGLEELEFDEARDIWLITIGFSRPWNKLGALSFADPSQRSYKVVSIDGQGKALSVKNREFAGAA